MSRSLRQNSLLVEPLDRTIGSTSILVGVGTFPVLKVEGGLGKRVERVLGLGLLLGHKVVLLFLRLRLLGLLLCFGSRCSGRLGGLLLLLLSRGNESDCFLGVGDGTESFFQFRVVGDGFKVADGVGVLGTGRSIKDKGNSTLADGGDVDVSE